MLLVFGAAVLNAKETEHCGLGWVRWFLQ